MASSRRAACVVCSLIFTVPGLRGCARLRCDECHEAHLREFHRKRKAPQRTRYYERYPEKRKEQRRRSDHARRLRMQNPDGRCEQVDLELVARRDRGRCQLCGEVVDPVLEYPDLWARSIDHVVPLSLGGEHTSENCQLAHWICNVQKGARLVATG